MASKRFALSVRLVLGLSVVSVLVLGTAGRASAGSVLYAKPGGAVSGSCLSWGTACELRYALNTVAVSGDQIWVAKGTYKPTTGTDRTKSFILKNGVAVYGGFVVGNTSLSQRKWKTNVTILTGEIGAAGTADNSYHVVAGIGLLNTAVLDGFTIKRGNANGSVPNNNGGGMYVTNAASQTLKNIIFSGNHANYGGGAMYSQFGAATLVNASFSGNSAAVGGALFNEDSSPALTNVTFAANTAKFYGGGMSNQSSSSPKLSRVVFSGNKAQSGGGMYNYDKSNAVLTNVTFNGNSASNVGGAMVSYNSGPTLTNVTFSGNSAPTGGGMYNYGGSSPTLSNVTFSGNTASSNGGAMYNDTGSNPTLKNATFSANQANVGAGIYNNAASPTLTNVTFSGNIATSNAGGMINIIGGAPHIYDSIFWNDSPVEIFNSSAIPTIADSIMKGGCPSGSSCSSVSGSNPVLGPLQNNGGLTKTMALGAGSAAINRGNNVTCAVKDQRGVSRPQGPKCDMGAYEVKALTFYSQAAYDGWVLETSKNSGVGGTLNSNSGQLLVGDDSSNRQVRSFVSFNTASLPDGAVILSAKLWLEYYIVVGTDPFTDHGNLLIDLAKPYFGAGLPLVASDFQAAATLSPAGTVSSTPVSGWYIGTLNSGGQSNINKTGTTQLRVRFSIANDNDNTADALEFYSGEGSFMDQPKLIVYYNP